MNPDGIYWLASYPRSGNTWIRLLLASALSPERQTPDINQLPFGNVTCERTSVDDALGVESADVPRRLLLDLWPQACRHIAQNLPSPRLVKTHARWPDAPAQQTALRQATAGAVLIVRHPADVAVSLSHFFAITTARAVEIMADPHFHYNHPPGGIMEYLPEWSDSWTNHTLSWLDAGVPLLVVHYEALSANPNRILKNILKFTGMTVSDGTVDWAVQNCRLENLQQVEARTGFAEAPASAKSFFRAGQTLGANAALTSGLLATLTGQQEAAMVRLGYAQ